MNTTNAIAKVRFSSARPQRVQLTKHAYCACDLLCLEPGQELAATGPCDYYVIAGTGQIKAGRASKPLALGNFADCDGNESHAIVNSSEQRLICLAITPRRPGV